MKHNKASNSPVPSRNTPEAPDPRPMLPRFDAGDRIADLQRGMGRAMERVVGAHSIMASAILWGETGNPAYIWRAIDACQKHGIPSPWWITGYLAETASKITSIPPRGWEKGDDPARKVYQALGFPRPGSSDPFSRMALDQQKVEAAIRVEQLRHEKRPGQGEGGVIGAINIVADDVGKSSSTVRDWYYELQPVLAKYPSANIFKIDPPE